MEVFTVDIESDSVTEHIKFLKCTDANIVPWFAMGHNFIIN